MSNLPAVSCVMPCGYGTKYIGVAIRCFLDQTYEGPMELVILDNNTDPIEMFILDLIVDHPNADRVKYHRAVRAPLGKLRNQANALATGDVIVNWDEDDWSDPSRVAVQVARLIDSGKSLTGFHSALFYDMSCDQTYRYYFEVPGRNHHPYAFGTTQMYLRDWWKKHPYEETGVEDWPFTQVALHNNQIESCDAEQLIVVRAHGDSLCPPMFGHRQFPAVERSTFPQEFFAASSEKQAVPANPEEEQ